VISRLTAKRVKRVYRWGGGVVRIEGLVGKPEGKRPLVRARRRYESNIKMELKRNGGCRVGRGGGVDWIDLA